MTKYQRLIEHLATASGTPVTLSFDQIGKVLGSPLAASARTYPAFWSVGNHVGRLLKGAGWRASLRPSDRAVRFTRDGALPRGVEREPPRSRAPVTAAHDATASLPPDLVLVGCVKSKKPGRHPARDLYVSTLFDGRRAHAEATGAPWFVISAEYGLVAPDEQIDTYDHALADDGAAERREWAERVLEQLGERYGNVAGKVVEIHAGSAYRDYGLVEGLSKAGAMVVVPLDGLKFGEQLAWYGQGAPTGATPMEETLAETPHPRDVPRPASDTAALVATLTADFAHGKLELAAAGAPVPGWEAMPELLAARAIWKPAGSARALRRFLTAVCPLNRARNADQLWAAAARAYLAEPWIADPETVSRRPLRELADVLAEHGVSQRHLPDAAAWKLVLEGLVDPASPAAVRRAVDNGEGDAVELREAVASTTKQGLNWFPMLAGPKVSVMWIRILAVPGGARITRLDSLPVAVDVQVRKVTEYLGVTATAGKRLDAVRDGIQQAWQSAARAALGPKGLAGTTGALDPALWFFAKWGCTWCERQRQKIPISDVCRRWCRFGGDS